jgi:predicted SnoaL-like aldol condensation-catalyzing enzyme
MKLRFTLLAAFATILAGGAARAQEPVKGVADPDSLFHDKDKKKDAMKQTAYHIEKDLLQCNHWEYHQHNPNVQSGLAPVMKFFGNNPNRPRKEACDKLEAPVVAVIADGDLVTVVTSAPRKDAKGQAYTTTWFDMWRIKDGKADEHWDPATK